MSSSTACFSETGPGPAGTDDPEPLPRPLVLVMNAGDESLALVDPSERRVVRRLAGGSTAFGLAVSVAGDRAYVLHGGSAIWIHDLVYGRNEGEVTGRSLGSVAPDPDGDIWVGSGSGLIKVDAETGDVVERVTLAATPGVLRLARASSRVLGVVAGTDLVSIDIAAPALEDQAAYPCFLDPPGPGVDPGTCGLLDLAIAPGESRLFATMSGALIEIDATSFEESNRVEFETQVESVPGIGFILKNPRVAVGPDASVVVLALPHDREVVGLEVPGLIERWRVAVDADPAGLAVSPDGATAWVALPDANRVDILDLETGATLGSIAGSRPIEVLWLDATPG